jgi:hypothetical protein
LSNRTTALGIFLLAFAAFAWLAPQDPSSAQVVTRLGLTLSIVESSRLDIDRFAHRTIDKALFEGRYYADKVPGLSFLAIPVVVATSLVINRTGGNTDSNDPRDFARFAKIVSIAVNGLISALAAAVLFLTAIRLGATRTGAVFAAGVLAFATPFFGWSTAFFAHSVSGSLLIFAAAAITFAFAGDCAGKSRPRPTLFGLGLGMLLGCTLVVDLTSAPACLLGGVLTLALAARGGAAALLRMASFLLFGGVLGLLPLLVYDQLAFGSPFTLGYSAVVGFKGMQQGFFGISWPKPRVVVQLLFGPYRGLLPLSPVLALVPVGLYAMWREPTRRVAAGAILIVFCSFLWINASYVYWWGGSSLGPRHLIPALPVCCLALAFAWPRAFWARAVALVLLAASLVLSLICAVPGIFAPSSIPNPLVDFFLPAFLTPEKLVKSLPIVLVWVLFGLLFLCRSPSTDTGLTLTANARSGRRSRHNSTPSSWPHRRCPPPTRTSAVGRKASWRCRHSRLLRGCRSMRTTRARVQTSIR